MNWTELKEGQAIVRWAMADPLEIYFPGQARPMPDKVDYCFRNGWVDTGDLPCRESWRSELIERHLPRPLGPFKQIVMSDRGADLDFSEFRHRPTLIRRSFQALIKSSGEPARFRIATCGGVNLWVNETHVAKFEPFIRNKPQETDFAFELPAGIASLTLVLEDLHERDTVCFFSLTCLRGDDLAVALPGNVQTKDLDQRLEVLNSLRFETIFTRQSSIRLISDTKVREPLEVEIEGLVPFARGGLQPDPNNRTTQSVLLDGHPPHSAAMDIDELPRGCLEANLSIRSGLLRLTRRLGVTNLPTAPQLVGDLNTRKGLAADLIAENAAFDVSVALVLAMRDEKRDRVEAILDAALTTIEERHDCSDFSILPLLRLWKDARDLLSQQQSDRLKEAILSYRYWLDEPGNDVMWFWSENHVLCFHTAQFIAGGLFAETVFANSGKTGSALRLMAEERLKRWFDAIRNDGLCEWNSAAYYPIDFLALFTLHDMEPTFRQSAKCLMDSILVMAGLHTSGGVPAGSQGRCYEKELLAGPATELGALAAIAFGGEAQVGYDRVSALFSLSDYEPPDAAIRFSGVTEGSTLEACYTQGHNHAGKLTLWKSRDGQLSSVSDLSAGSLGHQAHIVDVQMAAHPMARLWINHPGELKVWGQRRPSMLAGNHVMPQVGQSGSTALIIYDLDRPWTDIHFSQLYAPPEAFTGRCRAGDWLVYSAGHGHVAVWSFAPLKASSGFYGEALHRAHALRSAWVIQMSQPSEDLGGFLNRLGGSAPVFDPERLVLNAQSASGEPLRLTFDGELFVNNEVAHFWPLSPEPHIAWDGGPMRPWQ